MSLKLIPLFLLLGSGLVHANPEPGCAVSIDPEKALFIRAPEAVESARALPGGAWHFGSVMRALAGPRQASHFLREWIGEWERRTSLNGFALLPRHTHRLREIWGKDSQGGLDPAQAPLRLLAIAFRPDLRTSAHAGEGRLIYGALDPVNRAPLDFTVILEFRLPGGIREWAGKWERLAQLRAESYLEELAAEVALFATRENFLQLRTNDFLLEFEWEMREFGLDRLQDRLKLQSPAQTPDFGYATGEATELLAWIRANEQSIREGRAEIPGRFLGGSAPLPEDSFRWFLNRGLDEDVRKNFSVQTCSGCHGGDTFTNFVHVFPRHEGLPSWTSRFLDGELQLRARDVSRIVCAVRSRSPLPERPTALSRVH